LDLCRTIEPGDDHFIPNCSKHVDSQLASLLADASSDDCTPPMSYPTAYPFVFERAKQPTTTSLYVSGTRVRNRKSIRGVEKG
jgi:hypothetical protein